MPVNPTPCEPCKYYIEIRSPMPGECWNRCAHLARRVECDYRYRCPSNCYGYAYKRCGYFEQTPQGTLLRTVRQLWQNIKELVK